MLGKIESRRRRGRGWDGWMASSTRWSWVWVDSGSWWWTERPGVLQFMGSQRVGHDWATELNWVRHFDIIKTSVIPVSSCLQSFPASGSFSMSQFFASSGQSVGASASGLSRWVLSAITSPEEWGRGLDKWKRRRQCDQALEDIATSQGMLEATRSY